jgi:hypothetical protein
VVGASWGNFFAAIANLKIKDAGYPEITIGEESRHALYHISDRYAMFLDRLITLGIEQRSFKHDFSLNEVMNKDTLKADIKEYFEDMNYLVGLSINVEEASKQIDMVYDGEETTSYYSPYRNFVKTYDGFFDVVYEEIYRSSQIRKGDKHKYM